MPKLSRISAEMGLPPGLFAAEGEAWRRQRKIVMGARLMAVQGLVQRDEDGGVIHVVARGLEDDSPMLRRLSNDAFPSTLSQGDAPGSWRPPAAMHPRDVNCIPKSRDFH